MDKVSYALGIGIGHQLANMGGSELNIDDFAQAVKDVLGGKELKIKSAEAQQIGQRAVMSSRVVPLVSGTIRQTNRAASRHMKQ